MKKNKEEIEDREIWNEWMIGAYAVLTYFIGLFVGAKYLGKKNES